MVLPGHILGMNARVQLYTSLNSPQAKKFGFSKLRAKNFLKKHGIRVPQLYAQITGPEELRQFDWHSIDGSFAIKPASGSAGKGIIVIKKYRARDSVWIDVSNIEYTEDDLDLHVSDILDGVYSTWGSRHMALIEERIPIHPDLEPYSQLGTPDVRVIVYQNIPVMAMCRLPTEASNGRANLDQGALAVGIDMGTGKSTFGVSGKKKTIHTFPHNNQPVAGVQIPFWPEVLRTAVRAANATGLTYMGADIFVHPEKGPMIAEVNAYPGLSIQLANRAGLRRRLQRLDGIQARNVAHAVKIGRSLFADVFPGLEGELDRPIIRPKEKILLYDSEDKGVEVLALANTGRYRSVVSEAVATELKLNLQSDTLWSQKEEGEGHVPVVEVTLKLKDRVVTTSMLVSRRLNNKRYQIELGRKDLEGFLIRGESQ
jgi:alpha-L-glutamate ligase-like protein